MFRAKLVFWAGVSSGPARVNLWKVTHSSSPSRYWICTFLTWAMGSRRIQPVTPASMEAALLVASLTR